MRCAACTGHTTLIPSMSATRRKTSSFAKERSLRASTETWSSTQLPNNIGLEEIQSYLKIVILTLTGHRSHPGPAVKSGVQEVKIQLTGSTEGGFDALKIDSGTYKINLVSVIGVLCSVLLSLKVLESAQNTIHSYKYGWKKQSSHVGYKSV